MRHAARVDANQSEIVSAMRAAGAVVYVIGLPVDLLVGFCGNTMLMEIKTLTGTKSPKAARHTALQLEFMATWRGGPVSTVTDIDGALHALRVMKAAA